MILKSDCTHVHWTYIVLYYNCQTYWILGYLISPWKFKHAFSFEVTFLIIQISLPLEFQDASLTYSIGSLLINFTTISMVSPKGPRVLYRNWWVSKLSRMIHTSIYIPLYLHEYHTLDNLNGLRFLILIGDGSIQKRSLLFKYIYESRIIQFMAIQSVIRNVSKSKYTI